MPTNTLLSETDNYITKKPLQIKVYSILAPYDITFRDPLQRQKSNGTKIPLIPKPERTYSAKTKIML